MSKTKGSASVEFMFYLRKDIQMLVNTTGKTDYILKLRRTKRQMHCGTRRGESSTLAVGVSILNKVLSVCCIPKVII